jgi:2-succinyl-5-enolpyruvyl-6-hydroxy-3-cyclohexene-1-carboxylate synthase
MKVKKQDRAFFWATTFLRELHACGVSQLVISPGSRSTPLTIAAYAHPGLKTHVVLDERSAAFMALGMGKSQGKPAGLVCTSGTAAANYYPAIIEARHSGVPLLVLTADRPPHLRNIGASQAIDQVKLFGDYPVFFHEAGEPVLEQQDVNRLKSVAAQSVSASLNRKGPVHINFPFRKPLEPDPGFVERLRGLDLGIRASGGLRALVDVPLETVEFRRLLGSHSTERATPTPALTTSAGTRRAAETPLEYVEPRSGVRNSTVTAICPLEAFGWSTGVAAA